MPFTGAEYTAMRSQTMLSQLAPVITPARYAKGQMAVHCPSDGTGFKTRAMYLACALKARYSHRCNAYIMSPAKARKLAHLFAYGWSATCFGELMPPREPAK